MFDNNQAGMGYNPLAGNLRRQQVPQGPTMGMSGTWPGAYVPNGSNQKEAVMQALASANPQMAEIKLQNYQKL